MEKYIPSGLQRKDGTDIMCLSYEYYLAHPEEFKYEIKETKEDEIKVNIVKEVTIENFEAIARVVIEKNMPLGEYLLKIMKEHILPQNLREETEEIIEKVKNEKGENKNMLAVVEMIEKENKYYIQKGYEKAKKEIARDLLKRGMTKIQVSEITHLDIKELENL